MNWNGELPHTWTEVAGLVIVGLVVMILAQIAGGAWLFRYHRNNATTLKDDTKAIKDQVVNGHKEPMREDLDRRFEKHSSALQRIEDAVVGLGHEIHTLREELADERKHRMSLGRELREQIEDEVGDVRRRFTRRQHNGGT